MSETRRRAELRGALAGLSPDHLAALRAQYETEQPKGWTVGTRFVSVHKVQGYLLAPLVGLVMGYLAIAVVVWLFPPMGDPYLDAQSRVVLQASAFGVILSLGPVLAVSAMLALGHVQAHQSGLAAGFAWIGFGSSQFVASLLSEQLMLVPPQWLTAAAGL